MILPEDEVIIDLKTSCTKDEAVAKMLGWMKGSIRKRVINVTEHGIPADELPYLHTFEGPLESYLVDLRNAATDELLKAFEMDAADDVRVEKDNAVDKCVEKIELAHAYLADIDDELAKGELSALRIDKENTRKFGEERITIRSLHDWALKKYGLHILTSSKSATSVEDASVPSEQPSMNVEVDITKKQSKLHLQEKAILEEIAKRGLDAKDLPANEPGKCGVKNEIRTALKDHPLFNGKTTFDKAWQRVRGLNR